MKLILDNNIFFSLMKPDSINSYLFSSIKANFFAPEFIKSEFEEHKEECLIKSKLSEHEFEIRQKEVEGSITFVKFEEYKRFFNRAAKSLPDIDDSPYIALSLFINASIWSNDPHLSEQSLAKVYTTEDLFKIMLEGKL